MRTIKMSACLLLLTVVVVPAMASAGGAPRQDAQAPIADQYVYVRVEGPYGAQLLEYDIAVYDETNGLPGLQRGWTCADGENARYRDFAWTCDDGSDPVHPDARSKHSRSKEVAW